MVPHDGQCENVGKISRVERAVCVGDQGVGNPYHPGKTNRLQRLVSPKNRGFV